MTGCTTAAIKESSKSKALRRNHLLARLHDDEMFEIAPGASTATNIFRTQGSGVQAAVGPR
jgi:hypothetical protein